MMNVNDYLEQRLKKCAFYEPNKNEDELIKSVGLENYIYLKVTSKKFRKWAIDYETQTRIKKAITTKVSQNLPLQLTFPFGGYKLWRLPTFPEVDWAEFFAFVNYSNWLSPVLTFYKPGVEFIFSSDDLIIERMDNIPKKDTDSYFNSFNSLLNYFRKYFPSNMKMEIRRVADLYKDKNKMEEELEKLITEVRATSKNWDETKKEKMKKTSTLNIKWDGARDWEKLSEAEKQQKVEWGPILHDAYVSLSLRKAFVRGEDKIVVFPTPIPNGIALGTTKNSVSKFWMGFGVLEKWDDCYMDRILSNEQFKKMKDEKHEIIKTNLINMKNFQEIWIYHERMDFSKNNVTC